MRHVLAASLFATLAVAAPASAALPIHAHRGGPYANGAALYPESTMPAFRNAADRGWVLEVDAKLTSDDVPLVIHDATLDRTTKCSGEVRKRTAADIRRNCPSDVLGSPGSGLPWSTTDELVKVSTLVEVLRMARKKRASVNLEIKNVPTDRPDFDPTDAYARTVVAAVKASGFPQERLIVQSFWPPNLEVAKRELPAAQIALLTLQQMNLGGPAFAVANGYDWVAPQYSAADFPLVVRQAHALGLGVVTWTLNDETSVRGAKAAGADAVITDDPLMAATALGLGP